MNEQQFIYRAGLTTILIPNSINSAFPLIGSSSRPEFATTNQDQLYQSANYNHVGVFAESKSLFGESTEHHLNLLGP